MPTPDENIHHVLENPFMPRQALVSKKIDVHPDEDYPKKISDGTSLKSEVYFRQDSQFPQPYIWISMRLFSADNNFPNVETRVFNVLWLEMFKESIREMSYQAQESSLEFKILWTGEAMRFNVFAYNDSFITFFKLLFENVQHFQPTKQFFEDKKK